MIPASIFLFSSFCQKNCLSTFLTLLFVCVRFRIRNVTTNESKETKSKRYFKMAVWWNTFFLFFFWSIKIIIYFLIFYWLSFSVFSWFDLHHHHRCFIHQCLFSLYQQQHSLFSGISSRKYEWSLKKTSCLSKKGTVIFFPKIFKTHKRRLPRLLKSPQICLQNSSQFYSILLKTI